LLLTMFWYLSGSRDRVCFKW